MTLAEVRAEMHVAYLELSAALERQLFGNVQEQYEANYIASATQTKLDILEQLEHALERVEALAPYAQEDEKK